MRINILVLQIFFVLAFIVWPDFVDYNIDNHIFVGDNMSV